jgi:UDP-glucose 4-epimerase
MHILAGNFMRHSLITGGAGFIGSHLTELLLQKGQTVTIIDDLRSGSINNIAHLLDHKRLRFIKADVRDEYLTNNITTRFETIYHLAASVGVELTLNDTAEVIDNNLNCSRAIAKMAVRLGSRLFFSSSSEVYGRSEELPFKETCRPLLGTFSSSRWAYASSKITEEYLLLDYCKRANLPVVIGRLFNAVGPRQSGRYGMVIPRFIRQAGRGEDLTVYGDGRQSRSFCDVRDTVRAIQMLANTPAAIGEVVNIGSIRSITIDELARLIISICHSDSNVRFIPPEAMPPGFEEVSARAADISKLQNFTSWQAGIQLEQTISDVLRIIQLTDKRALQAT